MLTIEQIDEMQRKEQAATPGRWDFKSCANDDYEAPCDQRGRFTLSTKDGLDADEVAANFALLLLLRNAAPDLLRLAKLGVMAMEWQEARDAIRDFICDATKNIDGYTALTTAEWLALNAVRDAARALRTDPEPPTSKE